MKNHAIIPLFIPHRGCTHHCVFCNQKKITASLTDIGPDDVQTIMETRLASLLPLHIETLEAAFFGGSFTGLPLELQESLLNAVIPYKIKNQIQKIRLSTRPDYINHQILNLLQTHSVDIVELGAQSFDDNVLLLSERGHTGMQTQNACKRLQNAGFSLGIQLMIGLPGDTPSKSINSARRAVELKPDFVRIYPTVILENTPLACQYRNGTFQPFSFEELVHTAKEMVRIFDKSNIPVIRLGLKSTDNICITTDLGGTYHPAFRQIVEGQLAMDSMVDQINRYKVQSGVISFSANSKSFSNMIGHHGENKKNLHALFPQIFFQFTMDESLKDRTYSLNVAEKYFSSNFANQNNHV